MRIISGHLKGRTFSVPSSFPSRPTTDFAKEGLFNVLNNLIEFEGLTLLDLCVGTGNLSFEFVSRGAGNIIAVDENYRCTKFLKSNAIDLGIENQYQVVRADCLLYLKGNTSKFDIIIADPPYAADFHAQIVQLVQERELLHPDGILIIEHGKQTDLSALTNFTFCRIFGNVHFSLFEA